MGKSWKEAWWWERLIYVMFGFSIGLLYAAVADENWLMLIAGLASICLFGWGVFGIATKAVPPRQYQIWSDDYDYVEAVKYGRGPLAEEIRKEQQTPKIFKLPKRQLHDFTQPDE